MFVDFDTTDEPGNEKDQLEMNLETRKDQH